MSAMQKNTVTNVAEKYQKIVVRENNDQSVQCREKSVFAVIDKPAVLRYN